MFKVLRGVCAPLFHRDLVMGMQWFSIKQVFATLRTTPVLPLGYISQLRVLSPVGLAILGLTHSPVGA
jgi:hypothetical protein